MQLPEDEELQIVERAEAAPIEVLRVTDSVHPESELRARTKRYLIPKEDQPIVKQPLPIQKGYLGCRYHQVSEEDAR